MGSFHDLTPRQRLSRHVRELERLEEAKQKAGENQKEGFAAAQRDGFDTSTLKVVLRLRKLTPDQRRERRALEAIYMAELGMLEGDPLPDEARRRLGGTPPEPPPDQSKKGGGDAERAPDQAPTAEPPAAEPPSQPQLALKEPAEARAEGEAAAAAGKRIYDNPYPAGDPCRASWDEGWCAGRKSHGMDTPSAYQRRDAKPPKEPKGGQGGDAADVDKKGAA